MIELSGTPDFLLQEKLYAHLRSIATDELMLRILPIKRFLGQNSDILLPLENEMAHFGGFPRGSQTKFSLSGESA